MLLLKQQTSREQERMIGPAINQLAWEAFSKPHEAHVS